MPRRKLPQSTVPTRQRRCAFGLALALLPGTPAATDAADSIAGPVAAEVLRVVDGDTLTVEAAIWVGQRITVNARIRGIDTPELRGRCPRESAMATVARDALVAIAGSARVSGTAR